MNIKILKKQIKNIKKGVDNSWRDVYNVIVSEVH